MLAARLPSLVVLPLDVLRTCGDAQRWLSVERTRGECGIEERPDGSEPNGTKIWSIRWGRWGGWVRQVNGPDGLLCV